MIIELPDSIENWLHYIVLNKAVFIMLLDNAMSERFKQLFTVHSELLLICEVSFGKLHLEIKEQFMYKTPQQSSKNAEA